MILCSIISRDDQQQKWMFSTIPPPVFEVDTRYEYLRNKTEIRKVGVIYDQSPYANLLLKAAQR